MNIYFVLALILFLIYDYFWFKFSLPSYQKIVFNIQNSQMNINLLAGMVAYVLLSLGMIYLVLPRMKNANIKEALIYGGLYGLVVYGVFDFTNMALFKNWNLAVSIMDTLWGVFVCTLVAFSSKFIIDRYNL